MAIPITLDLKFVASLSSSVMVDASRLRGDCFPSLPGAPTPSTWSSCVQYIGLPVACTIQSLPAIPWIEGTLPVYTVLCPIAIYVGVYGLSVVSHEHPSLNSLLQPSSP